MTTSYHRDTLRSLVGIRNALEGIERTLETILDIVVEEREGLDGPCVEEDGSCGQDG